MQVEERKGVQSRYDTDVRHAVDGQLKVAEFHEIARGANIVDLALDEERILQSSQFRNGEGSMTSSADGMADFPAKPVSKSI